MPSELLFDAVFPSSVAHELPHVWPVRLASLQHRSVGFPASPSDL